MSTKKIALVTGANKGIGLETVRQLAQQNITVLLGARDENKGAAAASQLHAAGFDVRFLPLDVNDAHSQDNAAKFISDEFGKLDILINNAGVLLDGGVATSQGTQELWRTTFETNVFNLIALTQKLLPLIKKSDAGRIVNLTSILGSLTLNQELDPRIGDFSFSGTAYNASKAALNMFTINLANELKNTKIKVNAAHPGWVKTEMGGDAAPLEVADGARTSVVLATLPDDGPTGAYIHLGETLPW